MTTPPIASELPRYFKEYSLNWKVIAATTALYWCLKFIRRLCFHPLSHIPGPKLAAATHWYHTYWHFFRGGIFTRMLPDLHKKYGPVIRISPEEVEVYDHSVYNQVMSQKSRFHKDPIYWGIFGVSRGLPLLLDPVEHRQRKSIISPMFGKGPINEATDRLIYPMVEKLIHSLEVYTEVKAGEVLDFSNAAYSATIDIMTNYSFGMSWNLLEQPDFESPLIDRVRWITSGGGKIVCFPRTTALIRRLHEWFPKSILTDFSLMKDDCKEIIRKLVDADAEAKRNGLYKPGQKHKIVFDQLLNPPEGRGFEPITFDDMVDDALLFLTAGADTTSNQLQFAMWHLKTEEGVMEKVLAEVDTLKRGPGDRFRPDDMEGLQYFTAFLKETMRMNHGAAGRQPRVVPPGGFTAGGLFIPGGTQIGCNVVPLHLDSTLFREPDKFMPERWLGDEGKALAKWHLAFGKGDRQCIGKHLAYKELYLILAEILTRFTFEVAGTTPYDMEWVDHFVSSPRNHLKIKLRKRFGAI